MANLTFPSNPVNGQTYEFNGKLFRYDSTTTRWSATRAQVLGSLPDDIVIETPDLTLDNTAISFSSSATTVYVHYTVSDDVSVSIANNGLANSSYATATLSRSNNTITITSGTADFSSANVVVTATNNRTSNTASINLSAAYGGWDVDLTNISFTHYETLDTTPSDVVRGLFFKPDGLKVWLYYQSDNVFKELTLSTAWDISTQTETGSFDYFSDLGITTSSLISPIWKPDGTIMYVIDTSTDSVWMVECTTAWDLSTGTYDGNKIDITSPAGISLPGGLLLDPTGTLMYVVDANLDVLYQYTLSTAWDASTASYDTSYDLTLGGSNIDVGGGLFWNDKGDRLYIADQNDRKVHEYSASTPYDISSLSYSESTSALSTTYGDVRYVFFKEDGSIMYTAGGNQKGITQYSTGL